MLQIEQENQALQAQIPESVTQLRKMLMMSNTGRLRLEHIRIASLDLGLPEDFEFSRERGIDAENIRFSFFVNFPPGFKIGKYYKIAVWKWQRLPYWSPYEDITGYDLRSLEARKRMEKRAIATIHELLSLTVEKKITLERIAHFRLAMDLPKKLKDFLLQHQGIFYISTRGNHGKLHTIFLREVYKKGELLEPNDLYLARRKLGELILLSPRKANVDRELCNFRRDTEEEDQRNSIRREYVEDSCAGFTVQRRDGEEEEDLELDSGADSDIIDESSDSEVTTDVDVHVLRE
ncbi:hypothetical protein HHK36_012568 [Tetracentron sinense]|uniref:PORR domain-containing protein n=1 Tax=Tetracentron sinense TaxID=13715 RepID=A0A834Z8K7_TETSI|nr:hypothetical protein HHK36_012568 [Tetracentron sinense]